MCGSRATLTRGPECARILGTLRRARPILTYTMESIMSNEAQAAPEEVVDETEETPEVNEAEEASTEAKSGGNFISEKYRKRGPVQDFVADLINDSCYDYETDKNGKPVGKPKLNVDALCDLADLNGINSDTLRAQKDQKNAPGRIRMSLGNALRATARRRFGLKDLNDEWVDAPEEFTEGLVQKEDQEGNRLLSTTKAKTEEAAQAAV